MYIHHHIYERSGTTEKQTQRLLDVSSKNFIWKVLKTRVHEKVDIFNKIILNIPNNFTSDEIIACDDKYLPWVNNRIKILSQEKNTIYKIYRHNKDNPDFIYRLRFLQEHLSTSFYRVFQRKVLR